MMMMMCFYVCGCFVCLYTEDITFKLLGFNYSVFCIFVNQGKEGG